MFNRLGLSIYDVIVGRKKMETESSHSVGGTSTVVSIGCLTAFYDVFIPLEYFNLIYHTCLCISINKKPVSLLNSYIILFEI